MIQTKIILARLETNKTKDNSEKSLLHIIFKRTHKQLIKENNINDTKSTNTFQSQL